MPASRRSNITIDAQNLSQFFLHAANVIGEENVSRDATYGALEDRHGKSNYGDPFAGYEKHKPSGAVRPSSVPELQAIVKLANRFGIPLWTVSRGKNLSYGGSAPVVEGSVVLDLHRMNKIIEVNAEYGYAVVEPGVSFFDLYEEIQRRGLDLWPSCPAIGWDSVVGNTLDRGFGYTPNGEHPQSQCGLEVVLPNGDLLRTGMGAMKDSSLFALYKGGYGPSVDGLFFQSNLGVVTKLGIHITPAPEAYATLEVTVQNEEDLIPLIDILSSLMRQGVIVNSPSIANIFRIALTSRVPEAHETLAQYTKEGSYVHYEILDKIRIEQKWGFWRAYFSLYGPLEVVPGMLKAVQRAFSVISEVQIEWKQFSAPPGKSVQTKDIKEEEIPHSGIPTLAPLGILDTRGQGCGHMCFSPILPPSGRELFNWYLKAKQLTVDAKFDFFADFHVYPRYVIGIELVIHTLNEEPAIGQLYRKLLEETLKQDYSEYRTHVAFMDDVASHFDFNNYALRRFTTMLKDQLDPNGIISPGKSGIWNSDPKVATHL